MGAITLSSPYVGLSDSLLVPNQGLTWMGNAPAPYKYTGTWFDFAGDSGGTGNAVVGTWGTVPADAVAVELWVNGTAGTDYLFATTDVGRLGATGVIATNTTANLAASRWVASGQHMIIPFSVVGTIPSTLRLAVGAAGLRIQGRFLSQASGFPYLLASTVTQQLTGAAGVLQPIVANATFLNTGYCGAIMHINGSTPARVTWDGSSPTATVGDIIPAGTYLIDQARQGISLASLRLYLASGTNVILNSLVYA